MGQFTIGTPDENNNSLLYIVIGLAIVGALYFMSKRNSAAASADLSNTLPLSIPLPQGSGLSAPSIFPGSSVQGFSPNMLANTTSASSTLGTTIGSLDPSLSTIADPYTSQKAALPITSPSTRDLTNPTQFSPTAAGNCQCDDSQCCYWSPFMSQYGYVSNYQSARVCAPIMFGNTPQACNNATAQYNQQTAGQMKAMYARHAQALDSFHHYRVRPKKAKAAHDLIKVRANKILMYV